MPFAVRMLNGYLQVILPVKETDSGNAARSEQKDYSQYTTEYQQIYNDKGVLFYASKSKERVLGLDKGYLYIGRGSYLGIASNNGEFIYKIIDPESGQD